MKKITFVVFIAIVAGLIGCSKEDNLTTPGLSADQQAIQSMVVQSDSLSEFSQSDEQVLNDPEEMDWSSSFAKTNTEIKVFKWRRQVTHVESNVSVEVTGDSVAVASVAKIVSGNLILRASYSDTARHGDTVIVKPFSEKAQRKILFVRVARTENVFRNWRPVSITLVSGSAQPESNNKFVVAKLELLTPGDTVTVTNPQDTWLRFAFLRGWCVPHVFHRDSLRLRLTIYSDDDSSEGVALRWKGEFKNNRDRMKLTLVSQTGGSGYAWTRVYEGGVRAFVPLAKMIGHQNVVVDILSYGTLNDDTASVSNAFWGIPYDVRRR